MIDLGHEILKIELYQLYELQEKIEEHKSFMEAEEAILKTELYFKYTSLFLFDQLNQQAIQKKAALERSRKEFVNWKIHRTYMLVMENYFGSEYVEELRYYTRIKKELKKLKK